MLRESAESQIYESVGFSIRGQALLAAVPAKVEPVGGSASLHP